MGDEGALASLVAVAHALGVLKVQANRLDRAHLARWSRAIGVADLLARAFAQAGFAPDSAPSGE